MGVPRGAQFCYDGYNGYFGYCGIYELSTILYLKNYKFLKNLLIDAHLLSDDFSNHAEHQLTWNSFLGVESKQKL